LERSDREEWRSQGKILVEPTGAKRQGPRRQVARQGEAAFGYGGLPEKGIRAQRPDGLKRTIVETSGIKHPGLTGLR
jgi:hypothetical protein